MPILYYNWIMDTVDAIRIVACCLVVALIVIAIAVRFAPEIYDGLIVSMTELWYRAVLETLPDEARVIDIGVGTGSALVRNAAILRQKRLRVVGVDYDAAYVAHAARAIAGSDLRGTSIAVMCKSVFDHDLLEAANAATGMPSGALFDAVYFSGSFSLLPDPSRALRQASRLLSPGGAVYITQTFQRSPSRILAAVKPLLKYVTTIDFGRLMLEADIARVCDAGGMRIVERRPIVGSVNNGLQTALLVVCQPRHG